MKLRTYLGFDFIVPDSGGKAGKGRNVTGSIQLRKYNCIVKQFRYKTGDEKSFTTALRKAAQFCRDSSNTNP